jgi:hypothetical protein
VFGPVVRSKWFDDALEGAVCVSSDDNADDDTCNL